MTTVKQHAQAWHTFSWSRARMLRRMWVRWERESSINDRFPSNRIYSILYTRRFVPCISIKRERDRKMSRWNQYLKFQQQHDLTAMTFRDFFCFRSQNHCIEFEMSLAWSSNFTKSFHPPPDYHYIVTAMFVLIWFIRLEVTMCSRCGAYAGPPYCHNE